MKYAVILIILLFLSLGCVQQEKPWTELEIPGHTGTIYTFSHDIRDSLNVPVNDATGILNLFLQNNKVTFVFDGTYTGEDNRYFQLAIFNTVSKLNTFFAYEGKEMSYDSNYFIGDQWYNKDGVEIEYPSNDGIYIWLLGPNTGASSNKVALENNVIYIEGMDNEEITMAADRLVLLLMGVTKS